MSGHSHAKTIKRVKEANDAQRGKIFSKVARMISVAVREGSDSATNPKLRQALEEAKSFNMPKDNIPAFGWENNINYQLERLVKHKIGLAQYLDNKLFYHRQLLKIK